MAEGIRPTREAAEKAVEQFLTRTLPECEHEPRLIEDGEDGWAFWIEDEDTTSYVHHDLTIEWYGTTAAGGVPVSPSGGVWVEWEHLCSQKGERVLTTKGLRCRSCGLHEDDRTDGVTVRAGQVIPPAGTDGAGD